MSTALCHQRRLDGSGGIPSADRPGDHVQAATAIQRIVVGGARGGQGTSTVAAALAVFAAAHRRTTLVSDEIDAMASLLAITAPLGEHDAATLLDGLQLASQPLDDTLTVLDAGRSTFPRTTIDRTTSLVVLRGPCYLAVRDLAQSEGPLPDGIVLAREPGRSLTAQDVSDATGVPVVARVEITSAVARTIDAGLLVARLHRLPELASLRDWTTRHLAPRRPTRTRSSCAPTAVNDRHRLSTCAKRK